MLKKKYGNPSRKSAHYVVPGRFEGSDREVRGLIIKALMRQNLREEDLARISGVPLERLRPILSRLIEEGLVARSRSKLSIAD